MRPARPTRPTRCVLAASVLVGVVMAAGCGGGPSSAPTTTRPVPTVVHWQTLTQGGIRFRVPASWAVAHGVCRCPSDRSSSATLDNGGEEAPSVCLCPAYETRTDLLNLYAGSQGAVPAGTAVRTGGGLTAHVVVDAATATTTAVFSASGDWIIVGPASPGSARVRAAQVALEREIVDSAVPA